MSSTGERPESRRPYRQQQMWQQRMEDDILLPIYLQPAVSCMQECKTGGIQQDQAQGLYRKPCQSHRAPRPSATCSEQVRLGACH